MQSSDPSDNLTHQPWGYRAMIYLPLIVLAAVLTRAFGKSHPRAATTVGIASLGGAAVLIGVAEMTGNLLLFYLGALAAPFGVLVLLLRIVGAFRQHARPGLYQRD